MRKLQNTDIFRTIVMHWNAQRNADESNRSAKVRSHKKKTILFWNFSHTSDPPHPPLLGTPYPKATTLSILE